MAAEHDELARRLGQIGQRRKQHGIDMPAIGEDFVQRRARHHAAAAARMALPPGRGRGSSVGSIVCYLTGLSHVDPVAARLSLGRFLNRELASVPEGLPFIVSAAQLASADWIVKVGPPADQRFRRWPVHRFARGRHALSVKFGCGPGSRCRPRHCTTCSRSR